MIMSTSVPWSVRLFFWFPTLVASAHVIEEFVFPGGFAPWFRRCRPRDLTITTGRLITANTVMFFFCICAGLSGPTHLGAAIWLVLMGSLFANAVFHTYSTFRMREYSPGVVTAICLYIPTTVAGTIYLLRSGLTNNGAALANLLIGVFIMFLIDYIPVIGRGSWDKLRHD